MHQPFQFQPEGICIKQALQIDFSLVDSATSVDPCLLPYGVASSNADLGVISLLGNRLVGIDLRKGRSHWDLRKSFSPLLVMNGSVYGCSRIGYDLYLTSIDLETGIELPESYTISLPRKLQVFGAQGPTMEYSLRSENDFLILDWELLTPGAHGTLPPKENQYNRGMQNRGRFTINRKDKTVAKVSSGPSPSIHSEPRDSVECKFGNRWVNQVSDHLGRTVYFSGDNDRLEARITNASENQPKTMKLPVPRGWHSPILTLNSDFIIVTTQDRAPAEYEWTVVDLTSGHIAATFETKFLPENPCVRHDTLYFVGDDPKQGISLYARRLGSSQILWTLGLDRFLSDVQGPPSLPG